MTKARGVLRACEELGIDEYEVISPFMEQKHREAMDEVRRLEYLAQQVPSPKVMIPANPFVQQSSPKSEYHTGRAPKAFLRDRGKQRVSGSGHLGRSSKRRPSWK